MYKRKYRETTCTEASPCGMFVLKKLYLGTSLASMPKSNLYNPFQFPLQQLTNRLSNVLACGDEILYP